MLIQWNLVMQSYGDAHCFVIIVISEEIKEKSTFSTCTVIEKNEVNSMHCLMIKVQRDNNITATLKDNLHVYHRTCRTCHAGWYHKPFLQGILDFIMESVIHYQI